MTVLLESILKRCDSLFLLLDNLFHPLNFIQQYLNNSIRFFGVGFYCLISCAWLMFYAQRYGAIFKSRSPQLLISGNYFIL